jgi:hypothetical protein
MTKPKPKPANTTIDSADIQRARIEGKIAKEEADLKAFQDGASEQIRNFQAQANAEIAARSGRIQAYKELLGVVPEIDTTIPDPNAQVVQNAPEGPQEAPGRAEVPEPVHPVASAA